MKTITYIERKSSQKKTENVPAERMLHWLYQTFSGKIALQALLKRKIISHLGGWFMNTSRSAKRIQAFVDEHKINLDEFRQSNISDYKTFNQFFYRSLKPGVRPVGKGIVSPADGKILVFPKLENTSSFFVKDNEFTIESFLQNKDMAEKYDSGSMAIIRLAPADYHRFHFPESGVVSGTKKINGAYFSVSPLALNQSLRIFCENKREYCFLSTKQYGEIAIIEVGATMVGSIVQTYASGKVTKGDEKGYFAFGGSTVVVLFEKNKINFDSDLVENTKNRYETTVLMGETIAN